MTNEIEKQFFQCFGIEPKKEYYCPNCETKLEKWNTPKGMQYICGNDSECDYFLDSYDEEFKEVLNNLDFRLAYPQITDRILLELICILTCWHLDEREPYEITSINIEQLKNQILSNSLYIAKYLKAKQRVQALFKEG